MDASGLFEEDGYVIVGRAGQRVLRRGGPGSRPAAPRAGTILAMQSVHDTGPGAPPAKELIDLASVPCVSRGQVSSVELSGAGATRPRG